MNYTKPQVAVLGQAIRVIEHVSGKTTSPIFDGAQMGLQYNAPAYDLDE